MADATLCPTVVSRQPTPTPSKSKFTSEPDPFSSVTTLPIIAPCLAVGPRSMVMPGHFTLVLKTRRLAIVFRPLGSSVQFFSPKTLPSAPFLLPRFEPLVEFFFANDLLWRLNDRLGLMRCFWGKISPTESTNDCFGLDDFGAERALSSRSRLEFVPVHLLDIRFDGLDEQGMGQSDNEQCRPVQPPHDKAVAFRLGDGSGYHANQDRNYKELHGTDRIIQRCLKLVLRWGVCPGSKTESLDQPATGSGNNVRLHLPFQLHVQSFCFMWFHRAGADRF